MNDLERIRQRSQRAHRAIALAATSALACIAGSAALLHPRPSDASTAVRLDVAALTERAELVIEARVISARTLLDARGRIETEYLLDVERTWLGLDLPTRAIRLPGGVLPDGSGLVIPGMPRLVSSERAVLFLTGESPLGTRMPVGLSQGRFRVSAAPAGRRLAVRELGSLELVGAGGASASEGAAVRDYAGLTAEIEAGLAARRARAFAGAAEGDE